MSAQPPTSVSPPGSSAGWNWTTWLRRQKSVIKTFVSLLGAYLASLVPTGLDPNLQNGLALALGLAVRAALDWIDFRLSEVTLDPGAGA